MDTAKAILNGDIMALARTISQLENGRPQGWEILRELYHRTGQAAVVGIAGPPGVGKSTLINQMIKVYLDWGYKLAVLAVDPSSPFTGGSVLGDRVRMPRISPNLFIRSLASRGHLGGLSKTAGSIIRLLDACGFRRIIVETVGTGQSDVEIRDYAQTVIVVTSPNLGDDIQALKSGIMEIGDIFAVNKSDLPGAERVEADLLEMLNLRQGNRQGWRVPVVRVTASRGLGAEELVDYAEKHYQYLALEGLIASHRLKLAQNELKEGLKLILWEWALGILQQDATWEKVCRQVATGELDPPSAVSYLAGLLGEKKFQAPAGFREG